MQLPRGDCVRRSQTFHCRPRTQVVLALLLPSLEFSARTSCFRALLSLLPPCARPDLCGSDDACGDPHDGFEAAIAAEGVATASSALVFITALEQSCERAAAFLRVRITA